MQFQKVQVNTGLMWLVAVIDEQAMGETSLPFTVNSRKSVQMLVSARISANYSVDNRLGAGSPRWLSRSAVSARDTDAMSNTSQTRSVRIFIVMEIRAVPRILSERGKQNRVFVQFISECRYRGR